MAETTGAHGVPHGGIAPPPGARRVRVWQFLVLVVVYLVIVQGMSAVLTAGQNITHNAPTTDDQLIRTIVVPVGLAVAFTLAVVNQLGAWDEIFVDRRPVRRWLIAIPIILLITVVAITNYPGLADKGLDFALLLLVATSGTGLVFYLIRRRTGSLVAAMATHGLWDFSALSSQIDPDKPWPLVNVAAVVLVGMLLLVLILRRRVTPEAPIT